MFSSGRSIVRKNWNRYLIKGNHLVQKIIPNHGVVEEVCIDNQEWRCFMSTAIRPRLVAIEAKRNQNEPGCIHFEASERGYFK